MIIVFGSLNVDFVTRTETLPRPGETVLGGVHFTAAGGKGANQACAAALLGSQVAMVGSVGQDQGAEIILQPLREAGVDVSRVQVCANVPTGCALIMVDSAGENAISVASGANAHSVAEQLDSAQITPETLILAQMETPAVETWKIFEQAKKVGARTLLNVAPVLPDVELQLDLVDYLIVNEIELHALAKTASDNTEVIARALSNEHNLACVVTLGGEGALCVASGQTFRVPAKKAQVVDTTGAGDMFIGAMAQALDSGDTLESAVNFACAAAALACSREGAMPSYPNKTELLNTLSSEEA